MTRGHAIPVFAALLAATVATGHAAAGSGATAPPRALLPDLDQAPPAQLSIVTVRPGGHVLRPARVCLGGEEPRRGGT